MNQTITNEECGFCGRTDNLIYDKYSGDLICRDCNRERQTPKVKKPRSKFNDNFED